MEGLSNSQIAGIVMATGLVIVFVVLICLIFIIKLYGAVIQSVQKKKQIPKAAAANVPVPSASAAVQKPVAPAVEEGIPTEVVAAISAAVYTLYGKETSVLSVRRRVRTGGRCAWGQAGILNNTRPF